MNSEVNQNIISLEVNLTLRDYKKYIFGTSFSSVLSKMIILAVIVLLYLISFSVQILRKGGTIPFTVFILCLGFSLQPLIIIFSANMLAKRIYSANSELSKTQSYNITDYGITLNTTNSYKNVKWEEVFKVIELSEYFLVFTSPTAEGAFVLPKRSFINENQITLFKQIITQNLEKKKLKLKS
ncbi:MAG TPA: YcxB family protein [Clostridiaceae bacterium]|nr:YcxB family protein [Clostridiaceae bacterium]